MRPLNLASRPFRNEALPALLFVIAGLALLALSLEHALLLRRLLSGSTSALNKEVAVLEAELARLRRTAAEQPPQPGKDTLARWAVLKNLVDRRTFSWTELLASLEEVLPPGVRIETITPSVRPGEVRLDVSAVVRSSEDGLGFVHALEERPEFAEVYPLSVNEKADGIEFRYSMRYLPRSEAGAAPAPADAVQAKAESSQGGEP